MDARRRRRVGLATLIACALAFLVDARAQAPPEESAEVAGLFQQLATLRGLASPGPPPPLVVRSRPETRRHIDAEMARRYSPARVEAERKAMVAWGLIPADYDLRRLFVDLMEEQIAAYYDPTTRIMVLGDWLSPGERQAALLHELVHALQDRQTPLDTFLDPAIGQSDRVLARQAVVEGEAVGVMLDVLMRASGGDLASLPDVGAIRGQIVAGSLGPVIQRAPRFVRDLLLFPYVEGLTFIHQWRKKHPWSDAGALYRDPPRSSAQILHPHKWLGRREDPLAVALPDLGSLLPGFLPVIDDELGEFGLGAVLGTQAGEAEGRRLAAAWRGDRFRVWEDAQGRLAIAAAITVEGDAAARALALALAPTVERRHPALARRAVAGPGAVVTWSDGAQGFALEQRGAVVLLLEGLPASALGRLRDAVWRARVVAP